MVRVRKYTTKELMDYIQTYEPMRAELTHIGRRKLTYYKTLLKLRLDKYPEEGFRRIKIDVDKNNLTIEI